MAIEPPRAKVNLGFDQAQLEGLMGHVKEKPEAGQTVWAATTEWLGGFRSQAKIRDFTIAMDEPPPLGGSNTAPNMVEVVLGAYGCCLTTGYVMNAGLQGIKLEGVEIELTGDLDLAGFFGFSTEVSPGYSGIKANVKLKAPEATQEQLEALHQKVLGTSPVGAILSRPVTVETNLIT
jgi:uncharacterized OsmC-like protein